MLCLDTIFQDKRCVLLTVRNFQPSRIFVSKARRDSDRLRPYSEILDLGICVCLRKKSLAYYSVFIVLCQCSIKIRLEIHN